MFTKGKWEWNWHPEGQFLGLKQDGCYVVCEEAKPDKGTVQAIALLPPDHEANAKRIVKCVNNFDELVEALKGLTHRAECMAQSHQCIEHKGGNCCDLTYALEAIMIAKQALANAKS